MTAPPECALCSIGIRFHGETPLGPPALVVDIFPGVVEPQPLCAEHVVAWDALSDETGEPRARRWPMLSSL